MTPEQGPPSPGGNVGVLSLPDDEAVDRWLRVPPLERLRWLAEANEFLYLAQPAEVRRLWHLVRAGKI